MASDSVIAKCDRFMGVTRWWCHSPVLGREQGSGRDAALLQQCVEAHHRERRGLNLQVWKTIRVFACHPADGVRACSYRLQEKDFEVETR
jgi:hypothetical protein